ncbi:hypothetical protein ACTXT7_013798 [Hymenolepis weldensis]
MTWHDGRKSWEVNVRHLAKDLQVSEGTTAYKECSNGSLEAAEFIKRKFENLNRNSSRTIYTKIMSVLKDVDAVHEIVEDVIELTSRKLPKSR